MNFTVFGVSMEWYFYWIFNGSLLFRVLRKIGAVEDGRREGSKRRRL